MYAFLKCFSLSSFSYFLSFMCYLINNTELQAFYNHEVLDNRWIKLIQENPNLSRNCILPTESVNHFSTGRPIYLIQAVDRFPTGGLILLF
jgi:hypothetical protein